MTRPAPEYVQVQPIGAERKPKRHAGDTFVAVVAIVGAVVVLIGLPIYQHITAGNALPVVVTANK